MQNILASITGGLFFISKDTINLPITNLVKKALLSRNGYTVFTSSGYPGSNEPDQPYCQGVETKRPVFTIN